MDLTFSDRESIYQFYTFIIVHSFRKTHHLTVVTFRVPSRSSKFLSSHVQLELLFLVSSVKELRNEAGPAKTAVRTEDSLPKNPDLMNEIQNLAMLKRALFYVGRFL